MYLIDTRRGTIEGVNEKVEKVEVRGGDVTEILVVGVKKGQEIESQGEKEEKSITSGARCNPKLEKFIMDQISSKKGLFFESIARKAIER